MACQYCSIHQRGWLPGAYYVSRDSKYTADDAGGHWYALAPHSIALAMGYAIAFGCAPIAVEETRCDVCEADISIAPKD